MAGSSGADFRHVFFDFPVFSKGSFEERGIAE